MGTPKKKMQFFPIPLGPLQNLPDFIALNGNRLLAKLVSKVAVPDFTDRFIHSFLIFGLAGFLFQRLQFFVDLQMSAVS